MYWNMRLTRIRVNQNITFQKKLIQQYPEEYEQYLHSIKDQNNIEGSSLNEKLSDDESHAGPASNFVMWIQVLLGITSTTPASTTSVKPPTDCEPCTVCGRAVNGTKIVGNEFQNFKKLKKIN